MDQSSLSDHPRLACDSHCVGGGGSLSLSGFVSIAIQFSSFVSCNAGERWGEGLGPSSADHFRLPLSHLIEPLTLVEKMKAIQKKKVIKKAKGQAPSPQSPQSPQLQQSLAFNQPRHAAQRLVFSSELKSLDEPESGPFCSQSFCHSLLAVEVHSDSFTIGHHYSFILHQEIIDPF
ncbi:hypothetical protein BLNAU_17501 [Blattamonas nauphoetae]|uniref:Uncharacterized protein n=1 Tax=Blattamonas nauphoetae TaxID=2049346 RepID=A0ABQ9X734_9EUKA|nr:hypothetical protein BLNAU_17501 [Blattamonas nauphoetae]